MPGTLTDAILVATEAHRGQTDKMGQPYILHPLRVMQGLTEEMDRQIAALHDTIEDTKVTAEYLRQQGFSEYVVDGVVRLTKIKGEPWEERCALIIQHPGARKVKIKDIEDNLDVWRDSKRGLLETKDVERLIKYHRMHAILTGK